MAIPAAEKRADIHPSIPNISGFLVSWHNCHFFIKKDINQDSHRYVKYDVLNLYLVYFNKKKLWNIIQLEYLGL